MAVDGLAYLRKGGRLSAAQSVVGNILSVKPIITVRDGQVLMAERQRSRAKARARVIELIAAHPVERLAIVHTPTSTAEEVQAFRDALVAALPGLDPSAIKQDRASRYYITWRSPLLYHASSAIGWDKLPSASGVAAHEWGHNWGRQHAPCGDPANPDPNFPYGGGVTGVYGYDQVGQVVKPPTAHDLMGYCSNDWISDYTYLGVLNYRAQHPLSASTVGQPVQPALLVWGRIERDRVILEPAFRVFTRPSLPRTSGPYRIEGRAGDGSSTFRLDFAPAEVADAPDAPRSFAFAVPLSSDRADRLATLTLAGEGRSVTVSAAPQAAAVDVRSVSGGRVRLRWDATRAPVVLVRDPVTGQVISFARGGQADVVTRRRELSLSVGDRVGGRDVRVVVPPR